jgi:hypothetical protein
MKTHVLEFKTKWNKISPQNYRIYLRIQNPTRGDIKQVSYRIPTNIRLNPTIFVRHADPPPGNFATLFQAKNLHFKLRISTSSYEPPLQATNLHFKLRTSTSSYEPPLQATNLHFKLRISTSLTT